MTIAVCGRHKTLCYAVAETVLEARKRERKGERDRERAKKMVMVLGVRLMVLVVVVVGSPSSLHVKERMIYRQSFAGWIWVLISGVFISNSKNRPDNL